MHCQYAILHDARAMLSLHGGDATMCDSKGCGAKKKEDKKKSGCGCGSKKK